MANWFVWSGAAGAGTGADWANAYTTLQVAVAAKAAGDVFFVAHDHVQNEAANITILGTGTEANPQRIYCVDRAGSVPPVSADLRTTASIATNGNFTINLSGSVSECRGLIFQSGSGAATALIVNTINSRSWRLVDCKLRAGGGSARILLGNNGAQVTILENCTVWFGSSVAQHVSPGGRVIIRNTASVPFVDTASGFVPTALFGSITVPSSLFAEGLDLGNLGSGKSLCIGTGAFGTMAVFKDCKLGASVGIVSGAIPAAGCLDVVLVRCDSGDTNYRTERHNYLGKQETETTVVRTGGASDGTTAIAWKITTSATSWLGFECLPVSVWNETVGSPVTVTIQGIWGGGAVPLNDEIWIDAEYLGTSGFPLGSRATSGKADGLAAGASIPAGSGTWGGSTTKFAMSATFTPQEKGPITIYVKAAKPSSTFYVDPKPVVT